jgi:NAD(P)-dependent dehydrogenase (short-subunit alcohol dehydrogenase family)
MAEDTRVALITGASRGIGPEVGRGLKAKGYRVFLSARDEARGKFTAAKLGCEFLRLDVSNAESIQAAAREIEAKAGRLDALVNNAGILVDETKSALEVDAKSVEESLATNTMGPLLLCQAFIPMMKRKNYGRIVNVSSLMGQLSEMGGGYVGYRISKAALNAVTRVFAAETTGTGILINSVSPGWVRTEMGGQSAPRTVEQGADTIVWAATLPEGGPSGGFFEDRERVEW